MRATVPRRSDRNRPVPSYGVSLTIGIVGLPNVGKSTLFNALTKNDVLAANYPFATIDPNVGVVAVPDPRVAQLAEVFSSEKQIPATVSFVDIAGIVRGASEGEGLGNKFLANIRDTDAICQVIRAFTDENVVHVDGRVSPKGDIETIDTELLLADLASVERRLERVGRAAKGGDAKLEAEAAELERLRDHLSDGGPARVYPATEMLAEAMSTLITAKPTLYVANVDEDSVAEGNRYSSQVEKHSSSEGAEAVRICAKLEAEVAELPEDEAAEYLAMLGVETTGFEEFVRAAYRLLGLVTFFTAGEKESRAWTVREGSTVRQAAGRIHTDMDRGFVAAEVGDWRDIVSAGTWARAKEEAKVRLEGRDYLVNDGDTLLVRFNV